MSLHKHNKIIFTGPVGAGKTTAIQTISDVPVVHTEEDASDEVKNMKQKTTVAMDYGAIIIDENNKIHIYGTPGQRRFNFMWEILSQGCVGLILLIDGTSKEVKNDLVFFLSEFDKTITSTAVAIGVTKTDESGAIKLAELRTVMSAEQNRYPMFEVDARKKTDVSILIESLLYTLNPCLMRTSNDH